MAHLIKDSFLDLERHRQLLEDNIAKMRKALQHWQIWEAEYEGLKEEILAAKPLPEREQLLIIGRQYEGDLVTGKEIDDLLGNSDRTAAQVVNLLDRRIDYVEQNVQTIQKQIATMEQKLAAATVISTPEVRNEEGLPLTEIIEELDEAGNVMSSHTSTPGSAKPQLLEVLKKVGVKDLPVDTTPPAHPGRADMPTATKKGVAFTPDTKTGPEAEKSHTAKRLEDIMKLAKQQESRPAESPIIPSYESPEDAALRKQMLEYGMSEVGAVVAELDLEDGSDWSDDDYDEDGIISSDDEDAFGRSTGRIIDDELRQKMIELEERLGARVMENIGNKANEYEIVDEGIGRVTIKDPADLEKSNAASNDTLDAPTHKSSSRVTKKSVRFSEDLYISSSPKPAPISSSPASTIKLSAPVGDIIERVTLVATASSAHVIPKTKPSRFKANRSNVSKSASESDSSRGSGSNPSSPSTGSTTQTFSAPLKFSPADNRTSFAHAGPEGKTLASNIIERDIPPNASVAEPDELDPQLLSQEVATEYYKMRNRMIQRQGGFTKEEESEIVPLTEEEGGPRKISLFKAARLART